MKRQAKREHGESPKRKKVKFVVEEKPSTKENATSSTSKDAKSRTKKKEPTTLEKLAARADPSSSRFSGATPARKARSKQEKDEDAYIEYLESKLGWNKGGSRTNKYGKGLEEDGLDGKLALLRDLIPFLTGPFAKICCRTLMTLRRQYSLLVQ